MYLQTLSTQSKSLGYLVSKTISLVLTAAKYKPFVSLTADELVFGYDDTLVSLAHKFYPRNKRPMSKMGLLNGVSFRTKLQKPWVKWLDVLFIAPKRHQLVSETRTNRNQFRLQRATILIQNFITFFFYLACSSWLSFVCSERTLPYKVVRS